MGRINQLTPTTVVTTDSVIAVDAANGGVTNKLTINTLAGGLRVIGNYASQAQLAAKQDVLTFDDAPEEDSDNPVTSGGIFNALGTAMAAAIANSKPVIYNKVISGVTVSTDNGYSSAIPYSSINSNIVYDKIIGCILTGWGPNAVLAPQVNDSGLYIYSTKAFSNRDIYIRIVCLP